MIKRVELILDGPSLYVIHGDCMERFEIYRSEAMSNTVVDYLEEALDLGDHYTQEEE